MDKDIVKRKIGSRVLVFHEPKVKTSESEDVWSKAVLPKRITDKGMGAKSPAAGRFFVIFEKNSYFNVITPYFARF